MMCSSWLQLIQTLLTVNHVWIFIVFQRMDERKIISKRVGEELKGVKIAERCIVMCYHLREKKVWKLTIVKSLTSNKFTNDKKLINFLSHEKFDFHCLTFIGHLITLNHC